MTSQLSINPMLTSNAAGSFNISSAGYTQGLTMDDPSARNWLSNGVLANSETLPMWGGCGIYEDIPSNGSSARGGTIGRATTLVQTSVSGMTGFSVFDQAHHMINTPQSPVPLATSGMDVHIYRFGTNARIPVAMDPALISLGGSLITSQVSWDFTNQMLIPGQAAYAANVITAASWASTNGGTATFTTTSAHGLSVGSDIVISGVTPAAYNGSYKTLSGTTGSTIVVALPLAATPGAGSAFGQLNAGGGILPVKILNFESGNSMTVVYNATTGFATWNRSGSCALILI